MQILTYVGNTFTRNPTLNYNEERKNLKDGEKNLELFFTLSKTSF